MHYDIMVSIVKYDNISNTESAFLFKTFRHFNGIF